MSDRLDHPSYGSAIDRRRALKLVAGLGLVVVTAACGSSDGDAAATATTATGAGSSSTTMAAPSTTGTGTSCDTIPEETAGPYPGDGSNGPDVLAQDGVVRSDITESFGSMSGTAEGVPMTIDLTVLDQANGCAPLAGAAVYVWHCDREGRYSMYSAGATDQNYLRGVQQTDADGRVRFTSVFPAAYAGRWPHVHFEVYPSVDAARKASGKLATSQLALPKAACDAVYATTGYEQSVRNLAQTSLQRDMVFADGYDHQLATMTGDASKGYAATLSVPV